MLVLGAFIVLEINLYQIYFTGLVYGLFERELYTTVT